MLKKFLLECARVLRAWETSFQAPPSTLIISLGQIIWLLSRFHTHKHTDGPSSFNVLNFTLSFSRPHSLPPSPSSFHIFNLSLSLSSQVKGTHIMLALTIQHMQVRHTHSLSLSEVYLDPYR